MATKKQKFDSVVSAMGTLLSLVVALFGKLHRQGLSLAEALVRLAGDEKAQDEIVSILVRLVQAPAAKVIDPRVGAWVTFWSGHGFTVDPATLVLPAQRPGFDRLIVIPQGLTIQKMFEICQTMFTSTKYIDGNLDEAIPTNDRNPTASAYAIWIRERVEADEEFKNLSANQLKAQNHKGITVLEALADHAEFYARTSQHRDVQNVTLCSGSRRSSGDVPSVYWSGDFRQLCVFWCDPDNRNVILRSREVVS